MNTIQEFKQQFLYEIRSIRSDIPSAMQVCSHIPQFASLISILKEREAFFFPSSGSVLQEFPALMEGDDEILRFAKGESSFSVRFSDHAEPTLYLPATALLGIALQYARESQALETLIRRLDESYDNVDTTPISFLPYREQMIKACFQVADQTPDFGSHLLSLLLPDETYFVQPSLLCTLYDVDTFTETAQTLFMKPAFQVDDMFGINYGNAFLISAEFSEATFQSYDYPIRLFVKRRYPIQFFTDGSQKP